MFKVIVLLFLVMTETDAVARAKQLWGYSGFARMVGKNFQVGCVIDGNRIVVGSSKQSWDAAFKQVNLRINGPRTLTAIARDTAGNTAVDNVAVFICNKT